jgi:hypothetical protein
MLTKLTAVATVAVLAWAAAATVSGWVPAVFFSWPGWQGHLSVGVGRCIVLPPRALVFPFPAPPCICVFIFVCCAWCRRAGGTARAAGPSTRGRTTPRCWVVP